VAPVPGAEPPPTGSSRPMSASITTDPERAAAVLVRGGVVGMPTETVYGLAAHAELSDAVARIYAIKGRPTGHPLIVHGADASVLERYGRAVTTETRRLADAFWPGPLTLVVERGPRVSDLVTGGRDTVGLRVPDQDLTREALRLLGAGVAAPSANLFGRTSPTTAQHVIDDLGGRIDLVLDGGPCTVGVESTILDMSVGDPVILRSGGVTAESLEDVLGRPVTRIAAGPARAPGMLEAHYAPRATVVISSGDDLGSDLGVVAHPVALIAAPEIPAPAWVATVLRPSGPGPDAFARDLYALMRAADAAGARTILIVPPDGGGIAVAVRDRIARAASAGRVTG
jgi:L-threonylcarbamoyladenylate synthase